MPAQDFLPITGVKQTDYSSIRKRGFSVTYIALSQGNFLEYLDRGEYEEAYRVLERLPSGQNVIENTDRLIAIAEGYKMLSGALLGNLVNETAELEEEVSELDDRFRRTAL
mgnify:CR=1 FL=1